MSVHSEGSTRLSWLQRWATSTWLCVGVVTPLVAYLPARYDLPPTTADPVGQ